MAVATGGLAYDCPDTTGYLAACHAAKPPFSAETLRIPPRFMISAAPALDSSAGHVQYVTIGFSRGR